MSLFIQGNIALQIVEESLRDIGYHDDLVHHDYKYADVTNYQNDVRSVDVACFAQAPPSYRNACIGVVVSDGPTGERHIAKYQALGAPLIFEITEKGVNRWKITGSGVPEFKEYFQVGEIRNAFKSHENEWVPDRIFKAKILGESDTAIQLDFFDVGLMPLLEGMIQDKLDKLLRDALSIIVKTYKRYNKREPDYQDLFRLVFRFIAAKVMRDRNYGGGWDSTNARTVLKAVEEHYNSESNKLRPLSFHRRELLDVAWETISSAFHFQNLSVDDLAFVYESTFVTRETRKILGTHSTPPRIAEYIVNKLPFDRLPEYERHVLEPCAGHGGFLVAAMRRLRELIDPRRMTEAQIHSYLVERLVGIEIEPFAVEVCWLRLILADSPNRNGWQLHNVDIFKDNRLEHELSRAEVVLCNPPFEDFTYEQRRAYKLPNLLPQKPAELLRRILLTPPKLVGLVLPRNFESGSSYRKFHSELAEIYESIELVALPKVFNYSDAATMLLMASERRDYHSQVTVTCRKLSEGKERDNFLSYGSEPSANRRQVGIAEYLSKDFSLWTPPLSDIWDFLRAFPRLESEADVHRGINWKSSNESFKQKTRAVISDVEKPGYMKGYARVEDHFMQYWIREPQYLSLRPSDQYDNAYKLPWVRPKVVCNTARLRRGPWRLGAVADSVGLAFSQRFFAVWPVGKSSIFALAAVLNSPIANAYVYANEEDRDNRVKTLRSLPIPPSAFLEAGGRIDSLSRELHRRLSREQVSNAKELLLRVDAEILKAYNLPPHLERELLATFQEVERPTPVRFSGYYPADFDAYLPLHELISENFERARADQLLERLQVIDDPKISDMLAALRGEPVDESLPS